jgi:DNA polymerase-3 subunit alpha
MRFTMVAPKIIKRSISNCVHCHVHTEYSVLDGAIRSDELFQKIKDLKQPAVAITDHGTLTGIFDFYKKSREYGIKLLLGIEAYTSKTPDQSEEKERDNNHLILIAKNKTGYDSIVKLTSEANRYNFYYKPRIWEKKLTELSGNVICSSACLGGIVAKSLDIDEETYEIKGSPDKAIEELKKLKGIFGEDFYIEIQDLEDPKQSVYNNWLLETGRSLNIKPIITSDAHYLNKEDHELHTMMMAMQFNQTMDVYLAKSTMVYGKEHYIKTNEEFMVSAQKYGAPECLENTLEINDKCDLVELNLGVIRYPHYDPRTAPDYTEFLNWKNKTANIF